MTITIPKYIPQELLQAPETKYLWDDWKIFEYCYPVDENLANECENLAEPAICGLTIAISEWIVFRLSRFDADPLPLQCIEAAWCANIDRLYTAYLEAPGREWIGPVRGPLLVTMNLLHKTLYEAQEGAYKPIDCPSLMSNLVEHTCEAWVGDFRKWRARCLERLKKYYTAPPPIDDLYDEDTKGVVVPREVFDPDFGFDPADAGVLIDKFLQKIDYAANPLLNSPQEMIEAGFIGTPYRLT
jgi:hypothetical protein